MSSCRATNANPRVIAEMLLISREDALLLLRVDAWFTSLTVALRFFHRNKYEPRLGRELGADAKRLEALP